MKTKLSIICSVLLLSFLIPLNSFAIRGSGEIVSKEVKVGNFNSVLLASSANVTIDRGNVFSVVLTDYENLINVHTFKVENNQLKISNRPNTFIINSVAKVKITVPGNLYSVKISGSGDITISQLNTLRELSVSGSGSIVSKTNEKYQNIDMRIAGSGNIRLAGDAKYVKAHISGSGNIGLSALQSVSAECTITGSGNIQIFAVESLNASITGSGDIIYWGNPQLVKNIRGSGSVRKR